jgi:hypothetical protein
MSNVYEKALVLTFQLHSLHQAIPVGTSNPHDRYIPMSGMIMACSCISMPTFHDPNVLCYIHLHNEDLGMAVWALWLLPNELILRLFWGLKTFTLIWLVPSRRGKPSIISKRALLLLVSKMRLLAWEVACIGPSVSWGRWRCINGFSWEVGSDCPPNLNEVKLQAILGRYE